MVHAPGVGWTPDTEIHEEQEAHWTAVTEMWERGGQTIREAARAHRGPPLADQGHQRGQRIAALCCSPPFDGAERRVRKPAPQRWRRLFVRPQGRPLAPVEATTDTCQALDATWARSGVGMAVGLQRSRPMVECRRQPHERCLSHRLLRAPRSAVPHWTAPPCQSCLTNRRIRVRTHGGVGGGGREACSYPIAWL